MNDRTERMLADWLAEGPERGPHEGLQRALAATRRTSQRPGWTFAERWLPMQLSMRRAVFPRAVVYLALIASLALVLALAAFIVGSRDRLPARGPAANGLVTFHSGLRIYVADPDGTDVRAITDGTRADTMPVFSPDGSRIAYWSRESQGKPFRLMLTDIQGSAPRDITGDLAIDAVDAALPAWSPDGATIAVSIREGTAARLAVVPTDGSGARTISDASTRRLEPAWSHDGRLIAFRQIDGNVVSLRVIAPDGTGERPIVTEQVDSDEEGVSRTMQGFEWSPTEDKLVYHFIRGNGGDVAVVDLRGNTTPVGAFEEAEFNPTWSPDGRLIAMLADNGGAVDVVAPDGTGRRTVVRDTLGCRLSWSPDGVYILGSASGHCTATKSGRLIAVKLDDPTVTVVFDGFPDGLPSWQRVPKS
jgi:dipeptidyl aminopeptidase/acylaminoacyl peptidase